MATALETTEAKSEIVERIRSYFDIKLELDQVFLGIHGAILTFAFNPKDNHYSCVRIDKELMIKLATWDLFRWIECDNQSITLGLKHSAISDEYREHGDW